MDSEKLVICRKRPKGEDGYKTFSIRVKEDLVNKIDEISSKTGHSRNELIAQFLDYSVQHCVISDK